MAGNSATPKYTNEAWEKLLEETIGKIKSLAASKGSEYSGDSDRLDNFRRNGADVGLPMETVWRVYAGKHWDALTTYIRDLQAGKQRTRSEPIDGRVDDLLVYLLLFKAMLEERAGPKDARPSVVDKIMLNLPGTYICNNCGARCRHSVEHVCLQERNS